MGSDIPLAVVGKIVEKTVDPIVNTFVRQCSYKKNTQTLRVQLDDLDAMRSGVQLSTDEAGRNLEIVDPSVTRWLEKVDDIKSQALAVREGTSNVEKGCLYGWCPNLKHRYFLSRKATKLIVDVGKLQTEGKQYLQFLHQAPPPGIVLAADPSIPDKVVGSKGFASRIATMDEVMDALKDDNINLIGISGMGGVGKTTLMKQALEKVKEERLFKEVAMAVVSQTPDLIKIQGEIAYMLGLKFEDGASTDARAKRLCERLKNSGSVLVVLDDIWERIDLCEVGIPVGIGCKVKVGFTTRMEDVCIEMEVQRHIAVQMLSEAESWDLFQKEAGDCMEDEDLRDIAKDVVRECGGLPIAIVTLGKALSRRKKHEWEDTRLKLKQSSGMAGKVKSSIMLSYDFLGSRKPEAQPLLLLCTLFKENENIRIEWLVKYSMALNQLSEEVVTLEQTRNRVCTLIDNLKVCNLLLQGDGEYADLCVKLHDVVRDVCTSIASKPPHAYLVSHAKEMKQWPRHNGDKADHTAIALMSGEMNGLPGGLDYANLRLLQLQLECENIHIDGEFFQGMRGLKVFNYDGRRNTHGFVLPSRVILPPKVFQHLTNLEALSLENCYLGGDVSSIGCLKRLKILSFYHSNFDDFPSEVLGELKNLKLLDLRCNDSMFDDMVIEACVLSGLDQLEVLYMGGHKFSKSMAELNKLCCLTTLQISVSNTKILIELEEPLFEKLKRFDIFIGVRGYSCWEYGIVKNNITQCSDDLSWFSRAKFRSFMRRIQSFRLSDLDDDRFMLGESESGFSALYNLESLMIDNMMNLIEISPDGEIPQGCFPQLQALYLDDLPALKHLWRGPAQPPSLSKLRKLEIYNCDSLESLFSPDVAKCMLQLEELYVSDCKGLKGIVVFNQGKEGFENIQFPKLNLIWLSSLPNFKSFFYPEELDGKDGTIHTLFNQCVSFPSLEKIIVRDLRSFEYMVGYQMQDGLANKVRSNELRNIVELTMFENLEEVKIDRCDSMKVVFDLEGLKVGGEDSTSVFDKLVSIKLNGLKKLAHVWRLVPDSIQGFRNLTTLEVENCLELRYLMSYSVAKMLVNLQFLEIKSCPEIVGVIEGEDEECSSIEAKSNECIIFLQLQKLKLDDLKRLISFCSSKCSLEFPLLDNVKIQRCPDMKRFGGGEVNAPVLKEPVEDAEVDEWFWEGNLNNDIYRAKTGREIVETVETDFKEILISRMLMNSQ